MVARSRSRRPQRRLEPARARRSASCRRASEITRPSDDPYGTSRALGTAQRRSRHAAVPAQRRPRRVAWQNITDAALVEHDRRARTAPGSSRCRAPPTPPARPRASRALPRSTSSSRRIKGEANASYGGRYVFSGTETGTKPYSVAGVDTYAGNAGPDRPRDRSRRLRAGERDRPDAARRRPGRERQPADRQPARHRAAPARRHRRRRQRAAHHRPSGARRQPRRDSSRRAPRSAPRPTASSRPAHAWPRSRRPRPSSCPTSRTRTWRRR